MSYLGKVFESLKKKIQCFRRSKNFWCFRVFVLSYRAKQQKQSYRHKQQKIQKTSFQWQTNEWGAIFIGLKLVI